jgi:hypothetical protein
MRALNSVFAGVAIAALIATAGGADALTFVTVQPDGSASVRIDDQQPVIVPAATVQLLQSSLVTGASPAQVEALMSGTACIAPSDAAATAAVATYALSIAPPELSEAVVAGTLACNPDASDALETAAGPEAPGADVGVADLGAIGGISGAGSQELPRTGSPNQL